MARQQPRYAGLLPASQRSFGPQPPLGANRALGLRAYFQQQSMRAAARSSQLQQPQAAPLGSQLCQSQTQQYSQPDAYASSQEAAYAPELPMSQPQQQLSETQDPHFLSYSQPQALSYTQSDPVQAYPSAQANQGALCRAPLRPAASSQQLYSQQIMQRPPSQQQQQQAGYGVGAQYMARQASVPPRFHDGPAILPQASDQQRPCLPHPQSQSSAAPAVTPSPFTSSQQGLQQLDAPSQGLPPDSQAPDDGLLSYPPPSPVVAATTTGLAATAARLLGDISAMPATAASSQKLLERAATQQSMLTQLQETVVAVQEAGKLQSQKLDALESLFGTLNCNLAQLLDNTAARKGEVPELLAGLESRFKRILAAQSSRQRTLLLSTEQAIMDGIARQEIQHERTLAESLDGHSATCRELLQSALADHVQMETQQREIIQAVLSEQGQKQHKALAEAMAEAWELQAEQQSSFLADSLAEHRVQQLQALETVRADQQVFLTSMQQRTAVEQPHARHTTQPAILPSAGPRPPAAQLLSTLPPSTLPATSLRVPNENNRNGARRGSGTITSAFAQQKRRLTNDSAAQNPCIVSGASSINPRRGRVSGTSNVLVTYSRTQQRLAQSDGTGGGGGTGLKLGGMKRGRSPNLATAEAEVVNLSPVEALSPKGTLAGSDKKRQRMHEADAAAALASLAQGIGLCTAQDLSSAQHVVGARVTEPCRATENIPVGKAGGMKKLPLAGSVHMMVDGSNVSIRQGQVPDKSQRQQLRSGCGSAGGGVDKHRVLSPNRGSSIGTAVRWGAAAGTRRAQALELAKALAAIQAEVPGADPSQESEGFGRLITFHGTSSPEDAGKGTKPKQYLGQKQSSPGTALVLSLPDQQMVDLREIERQVREKMDRHRKRRMRRATQREE